MQKYRTICAVALTALSAAAEPQLTLTNDRELPKYQCGEEAVFLVGAATDGKPVSSGTVTVEFTFGGGRTLSQTVVDFSKGNPAKVAFTMTEPGFLLARIPYPEKEGFSKPKQMHLAGAAFEPEKIRSSTALPDDFMKFWEDGRQAVAAGKVELTELEKKDNVTVYKVAVDVLHGEKLYGYLAIPDGKGPFPAYINIPGAGPGNTGPNVDLARRGVITVMMNVHKFAGSQDAKELKKQLDAYNDTLGHAYGIDRGDDRERFHFRNVILGIDRVIHYVAAMPQYDKRHFVIDGSSQGGGLALALVSFNPQLKAAAANVAARSSQCFIPEGKASRPSWYAALSTLYPNFFEEVAPYYDTANFTRFAGPEKTVLMSCGYIDTTCTPGSIYAAYNNLKCPKRMIDIPRSRHEVTAFYNSIKTPWLAEQLGLPPEKD